jgi:iron complex outermembrane receptor protein
MSTRFRKILLAQTALSVAVGLAGAAQAQDNDGSTVDEVIVTASKREETLLKVTGSVSALTGEQLQRQGVNTFSDLISRVPNVSMQDSGGSGVRPIIRGVTSFVGSPTVGMYIDDAAIQSQNGYEGTASGGSPEVALLDIDRVEVLRGPQGTLYGGSAMGGAIKYVMKKPALSGFDAMIRAEGSLTEDGSPSGAVSFTTGFAPVEGKLGVRISGSYRHAGGFIDQYDLATAKVIDEDVDDQNIAVGRVAVRFDPSPDWSFVAAVISQRTEIGGFHTFSSGLGFRRFDNVTREDGFDRFTMPSLTINGKIGNLELTSATSYFDRFRQQHEDYSVVIPQAIPIAAGFVPMQNQSNRGLKRFSQELRVRYDLESGRAGVVLGVYFSDTRTDAHQILTGLGGAALLFDQVTKGDLRETALFGEAFFRPIDSVKLTVGLRQSDIKNGFDQRQGSGPFAGGPSQGERDETPLTPKYNITWDVNDDALVYAQAAKGFRPGGAAGLISELCAPELEARGLSAAPGFDSDELWTYEAGAKGRFADRKATFAASVFQTKWSKKPEAVFLSSCGETLNFNVGEVTINGAELETTFQVTPQLTLSGAVGYTNTEFDNSNPDAGFNVGDPVPFAPKWSFSASAQYRFQVMEHDAYARLDYVFRDKALQGSLIQANRSTELAYSDRYSVVNARLGVNFGDWDAEVFADNIGNEHPVASAYIWHPATLDADRITTIRPRTVGASISRKF